MLDGYVFRRVKARFEFLLVIQTTGCNRFQDNGRLLLIDLQDVLVNPRGLRRSPPPASMIENTRE